MMNIDWIHFKSGGKVSFHLLNYTLLGNWVLKSNWKPYWNIYKFDPSLSSKVSSNYFKTWNEKSFGLQRWNKYLLPSYPILTFNSWHTYIIAKRWLLNPFLYKVYSFLLFDFSIWTAKDIFSLFSRNRLYPLVKRAYIHVPG